MNVNKYMIKPETCITDIIYIIHSNKNLQVLIYLFFLGLFIKLYDNTNDWKQKLNIKKNELVNEMLKYILIFLSSITFMKDPGAVVGILAVHILCLHSYDHGFDDPFFIVGIGFLSVFAMINVIYYSLSKYTDNKQSYGLGKNLIELIILACIGYSETILFKEEISDVKFVTRFFVTCILLIFVCLDLFGYFSLFSKNIIQLFVCGIGYLSMDLFMNVYLFFMEPYIYNQLK